MRTEACPTVFRTHELAQVLGWSTRRTRAWLKRTGAGHPRGGTHGSVGRYVATLDSLALCFPELARAIVEQRCTGVCVDSPVLTARDVAEKLDWPTRRARRWLRRQGASSRRAGRHVTSVARLASVFPDAVSAPGANDPAAA